MPTTKVSTGLTSAHIPDINAATDDLDLRVSTGLTSAHIPDNDEVQGIAEGISQRA